MDLVPQSLETGSTCGTGKFKGKGMSNPAGLGVCIGWAGRCSGEVVSILKVVS